MADMTQSTTSSGPRNADAGAITRFLRATEIDTRLLGMIGALLIIWIGFDLYLRVFDGREFLTARNLWNLSVQTCEIAVLATGMVLVIVTRNIDLSVGSVLGFVAMIMGVMQAKWLPQYLGFDSSWTWIITLLCGLAIGTAIGAFQGAIIAFMNVPSFIVTLGGLLVWRGLAWYVTSGQTVAPMDSTFVIMGGSGATGSIGATWSWVVGVISCLLIIVGIVGSRQQRKRFHFPRRPLWAEYFLAGLGSLLVLGTVYLFNSYDWPVGIAKRYATEHNITWPENGLDIPYGIAVPVLIAVLIGIAMTFIATRLRFGRYVFAIGGNPEAAELAGIKTRWVIVKIFALMGLLAAVAAAISTARLNSAVNSQGTTYELFTIAAAVIGGTSLAGGSGTVAGAMLGALVMQSLQSGMGLANVDTPIQNVVVGVVLVVAVWLDIVYRSRAK